MRDVSFRLVILGLAACANQAPDLVVPAEIVIAPAATRTLVVSATDPDGDPVTLTYTVDRGALDGLLYTAPAEPGDDTVVVVAEDDRGARATAAIVVAVGEPMAFSEPEIVWSTEGNAKTSSVAVTDDGTVHVVWHDFTTDPANLYHASRQDDAWTAAPLPLLDTKSIRPALLADGAALDLVFDAHPDDETSEVWWARWQDGAWADPERIGTGEMPVLARFEGELHVLYYDPDGWPTHARRTEQGFEPGDPITLDSVAKVNAFGLALVGTGEGLVAAVAASTGEGFDDIRRLAWSEGIGWTEEILYPSSGFGSDEADIAVDADGEVHFTWTEQSSDYPYDIGVVALRDGDDEPTWVSLVPGWPGDPTITVPPDGVPMVAWVTVDSAIAVAREPYDDAVSFGDDGYGPRVTLDREGFVHLVYYGYDGASDQVWYATNRP